jgi:hypothetical protein
MHDCLTIWGSNRSAVAAKLHWISLDRLPTVKFTRNCFLQSLLGAGLYTELVRVHMPGAYA